MLLGIVIGLSAQAMWGWAEEITVTSYFPSPRGVYEEVMAARYRGIQKDQAYILDMEHGSLDIGQVRLRDKTTGEWFGLGMDDGRLLVTDYKNKRAYILFEVPEPESATPAKKSR
jgi:hypothetical protein